MTAAAEEFGHNHACKHMDISVLSLRPELLLFYRNLGYSETWVVSEKCVGGKL
jgi:hypothetical protein